MFFPENPLKMDEKCEGQVILDGETWYLLQRFKDIKARHFRCWSGVTLQKEKSLFCCRFRSKQGRFGWPNQKKKTYWLFNISLSWYCCAHCTHTLWNPYECYLVWHTMHHLMTNKRIKREAYGRVFFPRFLRKEHNSNTHKKAISLAFCDLYSIVQKHILCKKKIMEKVFKNKS